jgi:hypothetical protein
VKDFRGYRKGNLVWHSRRWAVLITMAAAVGACQLASIKPETTTASVGAVPPTMIVVYDFATTSAAVTLNQGILQRAYRSATMSDQEVQASDSKTAKDTAADLSDDLVERLGKLGFAVQKIARGTPPPDGALAVDGQFVTIDEGNRARRLIIGFGSGASKLDTQVSIYEVTGGRPNQLMIFTTHAESGKMPGAAVTMGAGAAAQGGVTAAMGAANAGMAGVKAYRSTMGTLADQTAKQITAYFSQYAANQRWIPEDKVEKADVDQAPQQ